MAHPLQINWCKNIKKQFPNYFRGKRVLDIGALDINGNNRGLFDNCDYVGLDVVAGPNVDVVCVAHEYEPDKLFDVVLSTNALEHDMYYELTLKKMVELLKPKGFMFFQACHKWPEHGTERTSPTQSGTSQMGKEWENYYKNMTIPDIKKALDLRVFSKHSLTTYTKDLRFWGIKK